jgi:hypothetical protein
MICYGLRIGGDKILSVRHHPGIKTINPLVRKLVRTNKLGNFAGMAIQELIGQYFLFSGLSA